MHSTRLKLAVSALIGATLLLAGCGSSSTASGPFSAAAGCKHIAFLLPESATAARWEKDDHPDVVNAIKADLPGATVDVLNAQGDAAAQQTQASTELTKGACILVVAPKDSTAAAAIVDNAKSHHVPVIAYDRLIQDKNLAYYASFDGVAVGKAQGQYIADHYQKYVTAGHNNLVMIKGSDTDNNAHLFGQGAHAILDPLVSAGTLKLDPKNETYTPGWDNATAQTEMTQILTATHNDVQIAYVMNDGMANTVIAALKQQGLTGKVLVTGQDAEVAGVRNILLGYQSMTVYKPIKTLADSVGQLVAAISKGQSTSSIANQTVTTSDGTSIPSILNPVKEVDIANIATTVIADGFRTKAEVCDGVPAGTGGVC